LELQAPAPTTEAFRWGEVLRLRVGPYRIMYTVEGNLITILRVDRRPG
jgi:mRNA-degrading endonuclease RelE of RelBE toxin-antitoxin system